MPEVRTIVTPVPPLAEQRAIVTAAASARSELDDFELQAERAISLLRERRSALITAAVTGQIDVRGLDLEARA